jgi:hypothetical protein
MSADARGPSEKGQFPAHEIYVFLTFETAK